MKASSVPSMTAHCWCCCTGADGLCEENTAESQQRCAYLEMGDSRCLCKRLKPRQMLCLCVERLRVAGVSSELLPGKWITLFFILF